MKMTFKKFLSLSIAICVFMAALVLPSAILPVAAVTSVWDGSSISAGLSGSGTSGNPYLIQSAADLIYASNQSTGGETYSSKYFRLDTDIDLADYEREEIFRTFSGTFDGNGHEIRGINIVRNGQNAGFFRILNGATIKNLTLSGSVMSNTDTAGGFAGSAGLYGQSYTGSTFTNCVNNLNVTGTKAIAGFVGSAYYASSTLKILGCTNNGTITATMSSNGDGGAGGFIGISSNVADTAINYSQNTGNVTIENALYAGGFIGRAYNNVYSINYCINTGFISGQSSIGGFVGTNHYNLSNSISYSINAGEVTSTRTSGTASLGAILGLYSSNAANTTATPTYYRTSDVVFPSGVSDAQGASPKGTANDTASEWIDGTLVGLLNYSKTVFKQGNGTPELYSFEGSGTQASPYTVSCVEDLEYMSVAVNEGITDFSGKYFKQTLDITFNEDNLRYENWSDSAPAKSFAGIGKNSNNCFFRGNFDGDDYNIYGLYVDGGASTTGTGLFGATHNNRIENLHIKNSYIKGNTSVGGIVGHSNGTTLINCSFEGTVYSTAANACCAGGIIGNVTQYTTLSKCYTGGKVSACAFSGGLIGKIADIGNLINDCYSTAEVDCFGSQGSKGTSNGGLIGLVQHYTSGSSNINRSFYYNGSFADVVGTQRYYIVGNIDRSVASLNSALNVYNCYYLADSADGSGHGTNGTAAQFTDGTVLTAINGDSAFMQGGLYPVFNSPLNWDGVSASTAFSGGTGTAEDPYLISSAADLKYWANQSSSNEYANLYIALTNDIDLADCHLSIAGFRGTFDGRGHEIRGINMTATAQNYGFFQFLCGSGNTTTVKNLTLTGCLSSAYATNGGFAGKIRGGNVSFINCTNNINITSNSYNTGGFVGYASDSSCTIKIESCVNNGNITTTYATQSNTGGFVGNCGGNVTNLTITRSQNNGTIANTGNGTQVSGFVAYSIATVTNFNYCINTGSVEGGNGLSGIMYTNNNNAGKTININGCINLGKIKTTRNSGTLYLGAIYGVYSQSVNVTNTYYRSADVDFNGASDAQGGATPKGTAKDTATDWTDGTIVDLLNTDKVMYKQGAYYPVFALQNAFKNHSLMLTDSIGVNFFVDLSSLSDAEQATSYMSFSVTQGTKSPVAQRAYFDSNAKNASGYYWFTCNINSVQMAETITPVLHYGGSNMITGATYSVKAYIDEIVNNYNSGNSYGSSEQLVALVKSIGSYGYHAQQYFTAKTFTALPSSYARTYNDAIYASIKAEMESKALNATNGLEGTTNGSGSGQFQYNLNFDTTTSIMLRIYSGNVRFTKIERANADYTDRRNDYTNSRCTLYLLHLKVSQLSDVITVEGTVDGNSFTIPVSAMSYVYGVLNKGNATTQAKNVVSALYDYHMSAIYYAYQISLDRDLNADWM